MSETFENRVRVLGIALPPTPAPVANYVSFVSTGNLLFLAGQGPQSPEGRWYTGKVGDDTSVEQAYEHARLTGIRILSVVRSALGSLDRVERVVKLTGFVNSVPEFKDHPRVINGCSDLMVEAFGEAGWHARSAVGVSSLP